MSDFETKSLILSVLHRTSECKFALIDLIRRHYFLIWMTSVLETNQFKFSSQNSSNDSQFCLFLSIVQIYNLIWNQLGKERTVERVDEESSNTTTTEIVGAPLAFLNQMYILMKLIEQKMILSSKKLIEIMNGESHATDGDQSIIRMFLK